MRPELLRFDELRPASVNVELQVHTLQTDGAASIEDLLHTAHKKGLKAIAFTEHVRRDTKWFPEFAASVRAAAEAYPSLHVYVGCEAKVLDTEGTLDTSEEILSACDIVLGSVHRFPDGEGGYLSFDEMDNETFAEAECALALGLLKAAPIDVLAHPAGMYQRRRGAYPEHLFREMLEASLEREVAVEINSSYLVEPDQFLRLCEEINPYVSVGSDVHKLSEMGRCRDMVNDWFGW